jgi:peptidoglycan/xylan/chitin deacetylase (PgdA/CDA1 family)
MRFDRALTLLAFRTIGSFATNRAAVGLPVLMYHSISDTAETGQPYYRTSTHPDVFAEQMRVLERGGYVGVTLSDGLRMIRADKHQSDDPQPVAITFDDGYRDFLTAAVPVLDRHRFKATMYLPTAFIAHQRRQFKGRDCLTWNEISVLRHSGFEFGSHTVNHSKMVDMTWDEIQGELVLSKTTIERELSADVTAFSYPYAFPQQNNTFVDRFMKLLQAAGYRSAVTTMIGRVCEQDDALCLKRLPVNSCDDSELLRAKLEGFYDWMAVPQSAAKQVRRKTLR